MQRILAFRDATAESLLRMRKAAEFIRPYPEEVRRTVSKDKDGPEGHSR
jgi:hypothetical protein